MSKFIMLIVGSGAFAESHLATALAGLASGGQEVHHASVIQGGKVRPMIGTEADLLKLNETPLRLAVPTLAREPGSVEGTEVEAKLEEMLGMMRRLMEVDEQAVTRLSPEAMEAMEMEDLEEKVMMEEVHAGVKELLAKFKELLGVLAEEGKKAAPKPRTPKGKVETVDVQAGKKEAGGAEEKKAGDEGGQEGTGTATGDTGAGVNQDPDGKPYVHDEAAAEGAKEELLQDDPADTTDAPKEEGEG